MKPNQNTRPETKIPVFVNKHAGSAEAVINCLTAYDSITLHSLSATDMQTAIQNAIDDGHKRIIVSGGDGTLALAAGIITGTKTELAIIPGGTLNHFAQRLSIPTDTSLAIELAIHGKVVNTHVAYVNDQIFLNTSSVGAYVTFVRTREYLERKMRYMMASILAGIRRLYHFRHTHIILNEQKIKTPLVFVGVGERDLQIPSAGQVKAGGREGLHLIVIRCNSSWSAIKLIFSAMLMGIDPLKKAKLVDNAIIDEVKVTLRSRKKWLTVAVDGELIKLKPPLHYRFKRDSLNVVVPDAKDGDT
ncbi:diacylglycerol/lipid kinase family protein [Methylophaga thalassica]|uniref:diacylglycerol/lipid kinase family protein n=1 Tax=Methylophaga aminisulfidivorans TaxID=230105 RepID=UPI003A9414E0